LVFGEGHGGVVEKDGEDEKGGVFGGEEGVVGDVVGDVGLVDGAEDGFAPDVVGDEGFGGSEDGVEVVDAVVGVFGEEGEVGAEVLEPGEEELLGEGGGGGVGGLVVEDFEAWGKREEVCGHGLGSRKDVSGDYKG
jgi:hypothetical protein